MRVAHPERRLDRFWGQVDRKHIDLLRHWIRGPRVLDLGCGYGDFTHAARERFGLESVGVDISASDLEIARGRFPDDEFVHANAEDLPLREGTFNTVVLRDSLHHLINESDWGRVSQELLRVSAPNARLIFFDPNVHFLLRLSRRLVAHRDEECTFERALSLMKGLGYEVLHTSFHTPFSMPLSGGFETAQLVPDWPRLQRSILRAEARIEQAMSRRQLGRRITFRYLIVGERK
jgi:ubiquinone/menaquinone biosynthesis C-methylase UbiE